MSKEELIHSFRNGSEHDLPEYKFQCHLHQLIQIWPGNRQAIFHEDLSWEFNFDGKLEPELSTMWALDDFTLDNGSTQIVLGSHRRQKNDGYDLFDTAPETAVVAECPKGSVIVFLGHTIHTGGQNKSDKPRAGLNVDYW